MVKIFVTGATGYIGGDAIYAIAHAHSDYEITALVRNSDKGAQLTSVYPKIKLVYGDLQSVDLLEEESKKADIVCHFADADNEPSIKAIIKGLSAHELSKPGFLIHTSGSANVVIADLQGGTFGQYRDKVFNDLEGLGEIKSLPEGALHANIDNIVLAAGTEHADRIKTAIVCPPTIYGASRGTGNSRSIQVPGLTKAILEKGHGVKVNEGKNIWNNIHVNDLSELYLKLVENAAAGGSLAEWPGKPAAWGADGYYFVENGEHVWGDVSQWIADEAAAQGLIKNGEVKSMTTEEASAGGSFGHVLWGTNSRASAKRAREVLGWKPSGKSLREEIRPTVEAEAKLLGLKPGHAKVAAGDA